MENPTEQLEQIKEIRSIMERSSRFISLSGLSGVFAGFFALAGVCAFYIYVNANLNYGYSQLAKAVPVDISLDFIRFCFWMLRQFWFYLFCSQFSLPHATQKAKDKLFGIVQQDV